MRRLALALLVIAAALVPAGVVAAAPASNLVLSADPGRLALRQCTAAFVRLGVTNQSTSARYVDVGITPQAGLRTSPRVSSYVPAEATVYLDVEVYVGEAAVDGTYKVRFEALGTTSKLTVPVDVSAPASARCIPRSTQTVTATSEQLENAAVLALDGRTASIWHTYFSPAPRSHLPQSITFGLGGAYDVTELSYLPRQDGGLNGTITTWTVFASTDGTTFTQVAAGTWAGDATRKSATFDAPGARYLRLLATVGVADYASAAELVFYGSPA